MDRREKVDVRALGWVLRCERKALRGMGHGCICGVSEGLVLGLY